jgi:uncharacterized membrane protein YbhN (UPF0104 family)
MMDNLLRPKSNRRSDTTPILQLIALVTGIFLLAFAADVLVLRIVELFIAGIAEQDTFFYSAVRQQDAFANNLLDVIKLISFIAVGVGFVVTLAFLFIEGRGSKEPLKSDPKEVLKVSALSLRGITTTVVIFIALIALYELLLRIVGNQPPFFLIVALVTASMYVLVLAYALFDYTRDLRVEYWRQE